MNVESFKVIYKNRVINPIEVCTDFSCNEIKDDITGIVKPKFLHVTFVDEDGEIAAVHDETFMFKFVRR